MSDESHWPIIIGVERKGRWVSVRRFYPGWGESGPGWAEFVSPHFAKKYEAEMRTKIQTSPETT